jgi:hypothetical protein
MTKETAIKLFHEKQIRSLWDDEQENWKVVSWLQIVVN